MHNLLKRPPLPHWLLPIALALPVLLPLLRPGFFVSDDGRFHVYRMAALAGAWREGVLHPRLFPDFGFGYGQAVLNFYAPLSYWPGAFLALLGISPAIAAQGTIALGFLLAALAMYGYLHSLWGARAGLAGAVVYTYFFYHVTDAYVRGAIPEHMAFLFPPLILWAYTALLRNHTPWPAALWGALAWAGLVLTHNLTALLMVPVMGLYVAFLLLWTQRWRRLWLIMASLSLAVLICAAYWLPVIGESSAVGLAAGPSDGYKLHLVPLADLLARPLVYPYVRPADQPIVYPVDRLSLAIVLLTLGGLIWRWRRHTLPATWPHIAFHTLLTLAALAMLTTAATPVWDLLRPALGYLQYPWRFLTLAALGLSALAAALPVLFPGISGRAWTAGMFVLIVCVSLPNLPFESLDLPAAETLSPQRMWQEDAETGQIGATWTGEFLPVTVREQRWAIGRPHDGAADSPPMPVPSLVVQRTGYHQTQVAIDSPAPFTLRLHQFEQPGWRATLNGTPATVYASGDLGLVSVDVPAGAHTLDLHVGPTTARRLGALLATLGVLGWAGIVWWQRQRMGQREKVGAGLLWAVTLLLLLNSGGIGQRTHTPTAMSVQLGDLAVLVGHEAAAVPNVNALDVTLYWLARRETAVNYRAFVHVVDGSGAVIAQHDGDPVGGFTPTTRWQPGELIVDTHRIALPEGTPAQSFMLKAGLYQPDPLVNLTVEPPTADNRVDLGSVAWP